MSISDSSRSGAFCRAASLGIACIALFAPAPAGADGTGYVKRNLVSDGSLPAERVDPNLINPWGIARTADGRVWVAANGNGISTVYDGEGNALPSVPQGVDIPGGSPTGIAVNEGSGFAIAAPGGKASPSVFVFVTEAGIISAWSPQADPAKAVAVVDNSARDAVYKGAAIAGHGLFLYATDFHGAQVHVFDHAFRPVALPPEAFSDPAMPPGFAPFGIHNIDGRLYVTYARQDKEKQDGVSGPGLGLVNVFDAGGRLLRRLVTRGNLNAPWGVALAPADFGQFGNHLLIANYGDGKINAYDPNTGEFRGQIRGPDNRPLAIDGLWGICFGNGNPGQPGSTLFFAASSLDESQGLYGRIDRADLFQAAAPRLRIVAPATSPAAQSSGAVPPS